MTSRRWRLLILTTHPIQYAVPWFRYLAATDGIDLNVLFLRLPTAEEQGKGFAQPFEWDIPLRDGYASDELGCAPGWSAVPRSVLGVLRRVRGRRPDAVLVTGWNEPALILAFPLLRLLGIPVIVRGDSNTNRPRSMTNRMAHRMIFRCVSAAVPVGQLNREVYLQGGVAPNRLFDGCHFVDTERLLRLAEETATRAGKRRRELGYCDNDVVFGFVGKHAPYKRPNLVIEAAAKARALGHPVKLLFAGSGEMTQQLREQAGALRVPTVFIGFVNQSELWSAYGPLDALVLPSTHEETWGLVVNEAMLFGKPVLVSEEVGCRPDLIRRGETGFTFRGDSDSLASAMADIVAMEAEDRRRMGLRARALVVAEYSMERATRGLQAALKAVA